MNHFYLFTFALFSFSLSTILSCEHAPTLISLRNSGASAPIFHNFQTSQDGFAAGTRLQTTDGEKHIESFSIGEFVIGSDDNKKQILNITKKIVSRFVRFYIQGEVVEAGFDQQFLTYSNQAWLPAKEITAGMLLQSKHGRYSTVDFVEIITEPLVLFALTIEDHIFCGTSQGLLVHNTEATAFGSCIIALEYCLASNPVLALLGASVALSYVASEAYESYIMQQADENELDVVLPLEIFLADRYYFEQRKMALEKLKQEFVQIKTEVANIGMLNKTNFINLTEFFLLQNTVKTRPVNSFLKISAKDEARLSGKNYQELRLLRETEFAMLEQEIFDLQLALVLHFNELVKQFKKAFDKYRADEALIASSVNLWNSNLSTITLAIAFEAYECDLLEQFLLEGISFRCNELKGVVHYYKNCRSNSCITMSTNIVSQQKL